eukprot:346799-Chlamydomonas_euryale.AAC.5
MEASGLGEELKRGRGLFSAVVASLLDLRWWGCKGEGAVMAMQDWLCRGLKRMAVLTRTVMAMLGRLRVPRHSCNCGHHTRVTAARQSKPW